MGQNLHNLPFSSPLIDIFRFLYQQSQFYCTTTIASLLSAFALVDVRNKDDSIQALRPGQLTPSHPLTHSLLSTQAAQTQNNKIGLSNPQAIKALPSTQATQTTLSMTCHTSPTLG